MRTKYLLGYEDRDKVPNCLYTILTWDKKRTKLIFNNLTPFIGLIYIYAFSRFSLVMANTSSLTQEEVEKLWSSLGQNASAYAGARAVYDDLRAHGNRNTSFRQLTTLLGKIPSYAQHLRINRLMRQRPINLSIGVGQTLQADLAEMPPMGRPHFYSKILVVVDPFDNYIYARPMRKKTMTETAKAFENILEENQLNNVKIVGTDAGKEFTGETFQAVLKARKIRHHIFLGMHKAFQAERSIRTIKGRLYRSLRTKFTNNWVENLQTIVASINFSHSRGINNLVPAKVNDPSFNAEIRAARKAARTGEEKLLPKIPKRTFKVGDYVYRDFGKNTAFFKSYDFARGQIYSVAEIDDSKVPTIYRLIDYHKKKVPGFSYASQLRPAPNPDSFPWPIEHVIKKRDTKKDGKQDYVRINIIYLMKSV